MGQAQGGGGVKRRDGGVKSREVGGGVKRREGG